jgi:hypothetical protein
MGNCANVRFKSSMALRRYYRLVQKALSVAYGDALTTECNPTNTDVDCSGIVVRTDQGKTLFQVMMYSTRRIVVDHRSGEVGYMVSDVLMRYLALETQGTWTEDAFEGAVDPGPERPRYFKDYMRQTHEPILRDLTPEEQEATMGRYMNMHREHYFTGNFAKYWEAPR